MRKFAATVGPSITLVVAVVMLFTSLAALLLANDLRHKLEETQGQLQDAQSEVQEMQEAQERQQKATKGGAGTAGQDASNLNKSRSQDKKDQSQGQESPTRQGQDQQRAMLIGIQGDEGSSLPLLLLALGLVVLASLVLIVTSAVTLLSRGSRSGGPGVGSEASTPSPTATSNVASASPLVGDKRWMKLVEECVEMVDELDEHMDSFDAPRQEVAGHVILRVEEMLERSGVEIISNDAIFDRARHRPDAVDAGTDNGAAVRETLSPGFAVGPRVLRRARVRLE